VDQQFRGETIVESRLLPGLNLTAAQIFAMVSSV
jgi:Uma2 family endonuclease